MHEWLPRLATEGIVGADAIFSCLGPALEIFSQYDRVEKANGDPVTLREYLEDVWAAISKEALSLIFRDADTTGLEPDARLTAMWLWTLAAHQGEEPADAGSGSDDEEDEEDEPKARKAKPGGGFHLEFDAARKIAQGLGARIDELSGVVEVKGPTARLLGIGERAKVLFNRAEGVSVTRAKPKRVQTALFDDLDGEDETADWGDLGEPAVDVTTLDRVHQSMLLYGNGRDGALRRFVVEDGVGEQPLFWNLAQSLSALYPMGSEEKRWVDGLLVRKKGFGFG